MPVMRPLWFDYPADYNTYAPAPTLEQFLVGRDLLVAPVLTPGDVKRPVYFPKGDAWIDWWTGARYEGGTSALIDAPLSRLPLFARAGAVIPVQPAVQHTGEMARAPLSVVVVSGARAGEGRIHQDAGDGYGYRRSEWRTTTVTQTGDTIRLKHVGDFQAARPVSLVEVLGLNARPKEIRLDGRKAGNVSYDGDTRRLRLPLPEGGASEITFVP
jgi:alpha-glucosidase